MCQKGSSLLQFEIAVMRKTTKQNKNTKKGVRFGNFFGNRVRKKIHIEFIHEK